MNIENCICKTTDEDHLYVIAVVSNPAKFKRRYELFNEFCDRIKTNPKIKLYTTELQIGDRPFATDSVFKVRSKHNLWHKENLINYTVHRLPSNAKYICSLDADIEFVNKNWASEIIEALQIYKVIQPFSVCIDMNYKMEPMETHKSFGYIYNQNDRKYINSEKYGGIFPHPGFGIALTRDTFDKIGGMLTVGICGSGDHHFWTAMVGQVMQSVPGNISENYKIICLNYESLCERHIKRNIGYISGIILHTWHGKKRDRQYKSRWDYLIRNNFDPLADISLDSNGIIQFNGNKPNLEYDLREYANSRNEDNIE